MTDSNAAVGPAVKQLDKTLNDLLLDPVSSFMGRASGRSMEGVGIFDGDLLLIDRKATVKHNDVIVATYNGLFVCKIADMINNQLCSANPDNPPIKLTEHDQYSVEGVVTSSIRLFRQPTELPQINTL
ncbi:LexA family protein [Pseudoalteromonas shioyasakiensis]|uniref:LexA family protein n=1 Tax=Pseudoalteromonas shioyasakiensis TaxID=1190813 RepID=UPI0022B16B30|nr:S24 family peptidase [Pseudoalteromonas shioyasakiensis]MCZ4253439.1 S24 family peptidase [Pseudoalteromonas shioyasakiensis]